MKSKIALAVALSVASFGIAYAVGPINFNTPTNATLNPSYTRANPTASNTAMKYARTRVAKKTRVAKLKQRNTYEKHARVATQKKNRI